MEQYVPLTVAAVRLETANAVAVTLRVPEDHRAAFRFKPGQFLNVRANIDGADVQRSYSICSDPAVPELLIAIKRLPGGQFSTWANTALRSGMVLEARPPQGRFTLPSSVESDATSQHILLLAAGAGITPVISILRHGLEHMPKARFTLVFGNRTVDDIMFRAELESLKDRFVDRLSLIHVLSRTEQPDTPFLEGRIDAGKIARVAERLIGSTGIAHAYVCGPGDMIKDARSALVTLGLARDQVHQEFFAPAGGPRGTVPVQATAPATPDAGLSSAGETEVVAVLDGARRSFRARPGESVIDAALRAGLRVPYACKGGMCCTCRAKLVEGTAEMRVNYSLELWELERGFLLTCQAIPTSPRLVVDYDQL